MEPPRIRRRPQAPTNVLQMGTFYPAQEGHDPPQQQRRRNLADKFGGVSRVDASRTFGAANVPDREGAGAVLQWRDNEPRRGRAVRGKDFASINRRAAAAGRDYHAARRDVYSDARSSVDQQRQRRIAQQQQQRGRKTGGAPVGGAKPTAAQIFARFDADRSGCLSKSELAAGLRLLGLRPSASELGEIMRKCDEDGDGTISYTEFVKCADSLVPRGGKALPRQPYGAGDLIKAPIPGTESAAHGQAASKEMFASLDAEERARKAALYRQHQPRAARAIVPKLNNTVAAREAVLRRRKEAEETQGRLHPDLGEYRRRRQNNDAKLREAALREQAARTKVVKDSVKIGYAKRRQAW